MGEQRHDEAHRLGCGAQAVKHRAFGGAERLMALVADEPLFLLRMDTDIAPCQFGLWQGSSYWGRMWLWGP